MEKIPPSRAPRRANELGPAGRQVARNIEVLREARLRTQKQLAADMTDLGRPMTMQMVSKIEQGVRRVDADDLLAFALALRVNPNALLFRRSVDWDDVIELPGIEQRAYAVWRWAQGLAALPPELAKAGGAAEDIEEPFDRAADFAKHALPQAGEFRADPALREVYNLGGRIERVLRDFANPANWDMRRDYVIRAYKLVGLVLEELVARGDLETTRKMGGDFKFDTEAAQRRLQEAAAAVGRPAGDYAPDTLARVREDVRAEYEQDGAGAARTVGRPGPPVRGGEGAARTL